VIGVFRPALLLFVICVGYAIAVPSSVRWSILKDSWPSRGVMILAVLACLSAAFGLSVGGSASYIINFYSRVLLISAVLMAATRSLVDVRLWVWAYVVSVLIVIVLAFLFMDTFTAHGSSMVRIQGDGMYDGNDLGVLMLIGVPLALLLLQSSGGWVRLLTLPVLWGVPAVIAMTGSRGSFVGLIVVAGALFFFAAHISLVRRLTVLAVLGAAVFVAAPEGYWEQMETIANPEDDYNVTDYAGRTQIWKRGLGYVASYPFFGVGVDNFPRAEGTISALARNPQPGVGVPMLAPHNTFLQVAAEMGVPAFLIWLSFFWVGIVTLTRIRARLPRAWAKGSANERFLYFSTVYIPVAFIGIAATTFFVSHAYLPGIYILLVILGGVLMQLKAHAPEAFRGKRAGRRRTSAIRAVDGRRGRRPPVAQPRPTGPHG
jgi:hypothetical protein